MWYLKYIFSGFPAIHANYDLSPALYHSPFDPLFVGCFINPGGTRRNFIFKIGAKFYSTHVDRLNPNTVNLRCRKAKRYSCKFRVTLKILHTREPSMIGFYDKSNFEVKMAKFCEHTCDGYSTEIEACMKS